MTTSPLPDSSLPRDPLLPQLPQALDGATMAAAFDALLRPHGRHRVEACHVERIKYRPRRNLGVAYRLALRDAATGRAVVQRVAARFCAGGDSARRVAKAAACEGDATSVVGLTCSHLGVLDAVVHWWPHDPKLGVATRLLVDPVALQAQVLPALVHTWGGERARVLQHRSTIVQAVPEHRVTARVELLWQRDANAEPQREIVYAKADDERRGATMHAVMDALARSPAALQGRLSAPRSWLWHEASGLHWQSALPGRALLDVEPSLGRASAARVGALLAALHATPAPVARRVSFDALRERLATVEATLVPVNTSWAPVLRRLGAGLTGGVATLRGAANVTLHGDLHPRNLLLDGERLRLIDLDSVREGPALLDLGDWIADALYRALLAGRSAADALPACRDFVAAYAGEAGTAPAEPALAWSVAHSLVAQRVWRCVVNLKPGRFALVPSLLALAGALLAGRSLDAVAAAPCREAV